MKKFKARRDSYGILLKVVHIGEPTRLEREEILVSVAYDTRAAVGLIYLGYIKVNMRIIEDEADTVGER